MNVQSPKMLVIYYSLEGNTRFIAETIAETIHADLLELQPHKEIKSRGFLKFVWGGKQVVFNEKPDLLPLDKKVQDYDVLFIGSPVWAGHYTPALNTFFSEASFTGKHVALFCCYAGQPEETLKSMRKALRGNTILGEIAFRDPLQQNQDTVRKQARQWAQETLSKLA